jgi:hypothetical protein
LISKTAPDQPPPADAEAQIETLAGILRLQGAQIAELAQSNAELRKAAGLDPPKPAISTEATATPWKSIKQISASTGFSQSQIRKLISQKRIRAELHGGRWFISTSGEMPRKRKSAIVQSGRTS